MKSAFVAASMCAILAAAASAAEVSPPVEVAPRAEKTRSQVWASTAWAAGAKVWLVVWREGHLTDFESDIWCARVSADGKALDPAGIRLTRGPGLKDHPRVASDGKGFLVVWEDLRGGKDWDVSAARVSGEGKALDENGFVLAGGLHNQARPDVAFAGGGYLVVWQTYVGDMLYEVRSKLVSAYGKPAASEEVVAGSKDGCRRVLPAISACGDEVSVAWLMIRPGYGGNNQEMVSLDARTGKPRGAASSKGRINDNCTYRTPALAQGRNGAFVVLWQAYGPKAPGRGDPLITGPVLAQSLVLGPHGLGVQSLGIVRYGAAFDGKRFLAVSDWSETVRDRRVAPRVRVHGWLAEGDGKALAGLKDGFDIAADQGKDQVNPDAAAGPEGVFLVVYSEICGPDDTRVLARIVK